VRIHSITLLFLAACTVAPQASEKSKRPDGQPGPTEPTPSPDPTKSPPPDNAPSSLDTSELDALVADQMKRASLPGVSLAVVKNGKVAAARAYGLANREKNEAMRTESIIEVASISKTITAVSVMQLVEQGKLSLDGDVGTAAGTAVRNPGFPNDAITIRMLLTHTSSIFANEQVLDASVAEGADTAVALADFPRAYFTPGGRFYAAQNYSPVRPGTSWDYCNVCIALLGAVVERAAGVPFERYTKDHVFTPLGMTSTTWRFADTDPSRLATPYDTSGAVPNLGVVDWPAGGLKTTATDLARFAAAMSTNGAGVVAEKTVLDMLRPETTIDSPTPQGFVFYQPNHRIADVWGHTGDLPGISSAMVLDPGKGTAAVVIANGAWPELSAAVPSEADTPLVRIEAKAMELARK
jgi:CubicO group peptidase (beta-lactamase class C family)